MNKILFFLFLPIILFAQDYLWPTNASQYLTSSFCEYRPGHYHSAIDIKTWNTEGYRIYAIENGQIERIRISPFGYGKVLYLKLQDGRTAVYAHLQRFNKKLEKAIREQQHKKKLYSINWQPQNWTVSRGDILGYTGQTGIGVPHLHFEIRDEKQQPLNPLHFYDVIQDHIPPSLQSLLITPLDADSRLNGSFAQQEFKLKRGSNHTYRIKKPIRARGKIGLALRSYDKADKIHNRFAFYRTTLEVDGKQVFHIQYDTLNFDVTKQMDIEIDFPVYRKTKKRYNKLYIEPFNQLPFYQRSLGDGIIRVENDTVQFKIEVFDFEGNKSTVLGALLPDASAALQINSLNRNGEEVLLKLTLPRRLQGLQFFSRTVDQPWADIQYFEIRQQQFHGNEQTLLLDIQLHQANASDMKIKAFLPNGLVGEKTISCAPTDSTPVQLSIVNRGKFLHLKTKPEQSFAELTIESKAPEKRTTEKFSLQPEVVLPASVLQDDSLRFLVQHNTRTLVDTPFSFFSLNPGEVKKFSFFENRYRLGSNVNSIYDTLLFQVNEETVQRVFFKAPVLGNLLKIDGQSQVLKGALVLSIKCDSLPFPARQIGISKVSKKGRMSWKSSKWDSLNREFSTHISGFGRYLLSADTTAPFVEMEAPLPDQTLTRFKEIRFTLDDLLSGIGTDRNIEVLLDSMFIIPEWDPERNLVIGKPDFKVKPGNHLLEIRVSDVAGNVTQKQIRFEIKTSPLKKGSRR